MLRAGFLKYDATRLSNRLVQQRHSGTILQFRKPPLGAPEHLMDGNMEKGGRGTTCEVAILHDNEWVDFFNIQ